MLTNVFHLLEFFETRKQVLDGKLENSIVFSLKKYWVISQGQIFKESV